MKAVHVITTLGAGGAENMLARLLPALRDLEWQSSVICLGGRGPIAEVLERAGITVRCLDGMLANAPRVIAQVRSFIDTEMPAVVQSWMYHADLIAAFATSGGRRFPLAWNIRQSSLALRDNRVATLAVARACALLSSRVPRAIVCNSQAGRDSHVRFGYAQDRFVIIPNGLDVRRFRTSDESAARLRATLGIAPAAPVIGSVARFDPQKDHATLFAALQRVTTQFPEVRIVLCGDNIDPDNPRLVSMLKSAGLLTACCLLGSRTDMAELYSIFDVFVSSSRGEGFPNALIEAMAAARPCVVTDAGDCAFIVGGTGPVVPRENAEALAAGISALLNLTAAERAAIGMRAGRRAAEVFSLPAAAQRYAALYDRMIEPAPAGHALRLAQ